jgi:hypothetical protein
MIGEVPLASEIDHPRSISRHVYEPHECARWLQRLGYLPRTPPDRVVGGLCRSLHYCHGNRLVQPTKPGGATPWPRRVALKVWPLIESVRKQIRGGGGISVRICLPTSDCRWQLVDERVLCQGGDPL